MWFESPAYILARNNLSRKTIVPAQLYHTKWILVAIVLHFLNVTKSSPVATTTTHRLDAITYTYTLLIGVKAFLPPPRKFSTPEPYTLCWPTQTATTNGWGFSCFALMFVRLKSVSIGHTQHSAHVWEAKEYFNNLYHKAFARFLSIGLVERDFGQKNRKICHFSICDKTISITHTHTSHTTKNSLITFLA